MVWICEKCGHVNSHEVSFYNRVKPLKPVRCRKCGALHPDGFYTTED